MCPEICGSLFTLLQWESTLPVSSLIYAHYSDRSNATKAGLRGNYILFVIWHKIRAVNIKFQLGVTGQNCHLGSLCQNVVIR